MKENFLNGLNTVIISLRRLGKTSLVIRATQSIDVPNVKVVLMDVYDCRSEYDFLNRFASVIMKETADSSDKIVNNIKEFLVRLTPKISFNADPNNMSFKAICTNNCEFNNKQLKIIRFWICFL